VSDKTSESSANNVLLTRLADEFAARYRAGERPSLKEYIDRHPELADDIRDLFPAVVEIEQAGEDQQDAAAEAAAPPAPTWRQLGDFRIIREVGKGGMGIVYEAEQVSLGRHVALKVLPKYMLIDARSKRRFEREAKSAARLHHTNIVPVFGVGEQDGMPYYVMQFIQGLGLDEVLDQVKRLGNTGQVSNESVRKRPVENLPHDKLPAAKVARSLLTGEFPRTNDPNEEMAVPATVDAPQGEDQRADGLRSPALPDAFELSSSSVVLPGQSRDGSKSKHRKQTYWQSVARIGVQVAEALEYAHKQGINHRDIKPSNLLLDTQGTVWVTDFGLAKADDQQNLTHTGDILGTLRYMPPEAFDGRTDARSDVYSLGLTLYEMLAFRPAFEEKERNRLIKQVTNAEPARLGKLNRQVPQDLVTIVHKAIDKDPKERYASAGAMAEDLRRFIEDEPIRARQVSQTERVRRWCRRNPVVAGLAAALALVFLAGFAGVAWKWQEAERQKDIAQAAERGEARQLAIAVAQTELATREMHLSRRLLYASDMNLAQQAWEAGTIERARAALERHLPQAAQEDLRGFEWRYLWRLCQDGSRRTLPGHTAWVTAVAFSFDGQTLATAAEDDSVRLWDVASWRHVKLAVPWPRSVAFAPDGKTLAIACGSDVRFWDIPARCERAVLPHHSTVVESVAFSSDGKLLATGCWDSTVRVWNVAASPQVGTLRGHTEQLRAVAFSRDGKILASGGLDNTVRLWDTTALKEIATFRRHTALVKSLSFSADGKTLASAGVDGTVQLWDIVAMRWRTGLPAQRNPGQTVVFSPDGETLATGGGDGTIRVWNPETKNVVAMLRGHTDPMNTLAYAPDGRTLVSGSHDGTVKVWDVTGKRDPSILAEQKPSFGSIAFSSDGKTLAVGDEPNRLIKLWVTASRQQIATLQAESGPVECVAIAPDGQTVAAGRRDIVRLWHPRTGKGMTEFRHPGQVHSIDFSHDGELLAAGGGPGSGTVQVWDRDTGQRVAMHTPGHIVRFSPDGTLLAVGAEKTVRLWDVATWRELVVFRGHAEPTISLAFAPDGKLLASGDWGGNLLLWDVAQRRPVLSRRVDAFALGSLAFSPDGRRLVTGGAGCVVRFWDVGVLRELAALISEGGPADRFARERLWAAASVATLTGGHDGGIVSVAFAPDGNCLATGSLDATVRLLPAPPLPAAHAEPGETPSLPPPTDIFRLFSVGLSGDAKATLTAEGGASRVDVTVVDGTAWHAQLAQSFDDLHEGANYTVRFRAKADVPRPIQLVGIIGEDNYHGIGLGETVSLTKDWRDYEFRFQAKDLAAKNQIHFDVGERTGTVWIADFTVIKITQ
jgi:WD40 repeat protein/serine/threonine protein kinase